MDAKLTYSQFCRELANYFENFQIHHHLKSSLIQELSIVFKLKVVLILKTEELSFQLKSSLNNWVHVYVNLAFQNSLISTAQERA